LQENYHLGWLLCDGEAYPNQQYPELYEVIREKYVPSNSWVIEANKRSIAEKFFHVPNLRKLTGQAEESPCILNYIINTGKIDKKWATSHLLEMSQSQDTSTKKNQSLTWLKSKDEAVYERFLKGALIYRPNPDSDDGKLVLPIEALKNPLNDTFDLSKCGDTGKYLSISTGYRKEKKPENKNKVEIWLTPRFLLEGGLHQGNTDHLRWILPYWNTEVSVGIFWTWGEWGNMGWHDYIITRGFDELSSGNLYEKWERSLCQSAASAQGREERWPPHPMIMIHFNPSFVS